MLFVVAFACSLFLVSIFLPFLQVWRLEWIGFPEMRPGPQTFWSFKGRFEWWTIGGNKVTEPWFADYWSQMSYFVFVAQPLGSWITPVLIFMFEAQVVTILSALLAIFRLKPYLLVLSTGFNAFTTFCMWFISEALSSWYSKRFEAGFWVSFPSAALFLLAFLLSRNWVQKSPITS